jgi:hypothetical protein
MHFTLLSNDYVFIEQAAMEREVELEHRAVESSTALARIQVTSAFTDVQLLRIVLATLLVCGLYEF